ncbi:MAG TPA: glycosyltransferase family 39 protein [Thermoanaerobaculia bacterium]|nr:glycosyltransferase family 39 protein [Thermoanaerobaculia bacterium]
MLRPLMPVDETRYTSVAWEMWTRGDLLVPHLNGLPYSNKPPLLFWLMNLGWRVFGVNEQWPRLIPSLFALLNLFLTMALARRLWPGRPAVARAAPAVLVGLLLWSVFTGMLMFDMLVAFCVLLALLGLHAAWTRGGWIPWLQVAAALGVGILAKGPVALLPPLIVAVLVPWWGGRKPDVRWWLGLAAAVAVGTAIALAWALPAARAGGPEYANAILFSQTEERMVNSFAHRRPWWWYLALLPVLLFPYSLWPPLWRAMGRLRAADPGTRFCLAWALPALAALSAISGKQPHYLLPLLPAIALLCARLLDDPAPSLRRWQALPASAALLLVAAVIASSPFLVRDAEWSRWVERAWPVAGLVLGAATLACLVFFDRIFPRWSAAPSLLSILLVAGLYTGGSGAFRKAYDIRPMALYLAEAQRQGLPIAYVGPYHGELHFLGRLERPFEVIHPGAERLWLARHPDGKVVQELDMAPYGIGAAELSQPYRTETLVVWGREALHPYPSG